MSESKMSLYDVLHILKDATRKEIRKAYKRMAHKHHPDKEGGSEEAFNEVREAYIILYDEEKREHYDATGEILEKENGERTKMQDAVIQLSAVFTQILRANLSKYKTTNYVREVRKVIDQNRMTILPQISGLKDSIENLKEVKKRMSNKHEETNPIFEEVIRKEIEQAEFAVADGENKQDVLGIMKELIEDYDYRIDDFYSMYTNPAAINSAATIALSDSILGVTPEA